MMSGKVVDIIWRQKQYHLTTWMGFKTVKYAHGALAWIGFIEKCRQLVIYLSPSVKWFGSAIATIPQKYTKGLYVVFQNTASFLRDIGGWLYQ